MADYIINLCHGHIDYLQRLPKGVIRNILKFVDLEDIAKVALLNKNFYQVSAGGRNKPLFIYDPVDIYGLVYMRSNLCDPVYAVQFI